MAERSLGIVSFESATFSGLSGLDVRLGTDIEVIQIGGTSKESQFREALEFLGDFQHRCVVYGNASVFSPLFLLSVISLNGPSKREKFKSAVLESGLEGVVILDETTGSQNGKVTITSKNTIPWDIGIRTSTKVTGLDTIEIDDSKPWNLAAWLKSIGVDFTPLLLKNMFMPDLEFDVDVGHEQRIFDHLFRATGVYQRKPGIYVLLAPPGFGKTTILQELIMNGIRPIPKITTRPYRSESEEHIGEVESVPFNRLFSIDNARLYGIHQTHENTYAYRTSDIEDTLRSDATKILTTTQPEIAFDLKKKYGCAIKIAVITRTPSLIPFGLLKRLEEGEKSLVNTYTQRDLEEYLKRQKYLVEDSKRRLREVEQNYVRILERAPEADIVLDSPSIEENAERLLQEIYVEQK